MPRTIEIANQKGGVAKTTTACTLAHGLARRGYTVCLVDLDAQGNASIALGQKPSPGLSRLLINHAKLADVLVEVRPELWLLPGDTSTAELKNELAGRDFRERILARALAGLTTDFVILDTGPSRDLLHTMAAMASDEVIIPAALDHLALVGVAQQLDSLSDVRENGHPLEVTAILPTFYDSVTRESATNLQHLADTYGDLVLPAVPRTTRLREAPAYGQTLWEYLPEGAPAWIAYLALITRVLHE
jgi:chromosome partitioning protein